MAEFPSFWETGGYQPGVNYGPASGAAPAASGAQMMTEAEIAAAKARIARLAPYGASGAAPAAAPAAASVPTGMGYKVGKAAGRMVGGTLVPALALGEMGAGMADQAAATTAGATPENRPERALQILSGADVTGFGARIGRMLSGGDFFNSGVAPAASAAPAAPATTAAPAVTAAPTGSVASYLNGPGAVANNTAITPAAEAPSVVDGALAEPHGASPGIGAQLVAGPATTAVSSSRDANGNLVLTNAPPGPVGPGAVPQGFQARPGSLASFFGAAMRQKQAGAQDAAARATALKLPEIAKTQAETTILSERAKLAAAEPDPAKKAAILSGTSLPKDETTFPTGLQPLEGGYGVGAKGGKLTRVPITQAATTADFAADVKRLGSKEAVLAEYARRNITPPDASKGAAAKPAFDFNAEPPPGMQIAHDYVGRPLPYYEPFGTMH